MLYYVTWYCPLMISHSTVDVLLCYAKLCYVMFECASLCNHISQYSILLYCTTTICYAMLCHVVHLRYSRSHGVPCYVFCMIQYRGDYRLGRIRRVHPFFDCHVTFAWLQNTNIKQVDHQERWRLFSERIGTNSKEKKEGVKNSDSKTTGNDNGIDL